MQAAHTEPLASAVSLQGTVGEQLVPCKPSLLVELGVSGVAVATATTCTNPVVSRSESQPLVFARATSSCP
jgi:hypothetical protein